MEILRKLVLVAGDNRDNTIVTKNYRTCIGIAAVEVYFDISGGICHGDGIDNNRPFGAVWYNSMVYRHQVGIVTFNTNALLCIA